MIPFTSKAQKSDKKRAELLWLAKTHTSDALFILQAAGSYKFQKYARGKTIDDHISSYVAENGGRTGIGIFEHKRIQYEALLEDEQHEILEQFKIEGATLENYQSFLE